MKSFLIAVLNVIVEIGTMLILISGVVFAVWGGFAYGELDHYGPVIAALIMIGAVFVALILFGTLALALRIEEHLRTIADSINLGPRLQEKRNEPSLG